ncbi:hypothetical protein ACTXT7_011104 [Hymenolepis weldensis]
MEDFKIIKIIGSGKFSVIYKAIRTRGKYKNREFAIKRYFLSERSAICRALNERKILACLASGNSTSPFVSSLFMATGSWKTPCCIVTLGSEYNLNDLVISVGPLKEDEARFYAAEIMCGLEYIHWREIVHRDIKPKNILLSQTGHAIITDFDLAYDLVGDTKGMQSVVFAGTLDYMAPEIANNIVVTKKADIWSLGVLIAHLVSPTFRANINTRLRTAEEGVNERSNTVSLSKELMEFINACLEYDLDLRPEVEDLKTFKFFKSIDWKKVAACRIKPPFKINQLRFSHIDKFTVDPFNEEVLLTALHLNKPILKCSSRKSDTSKLQFIPKNLENLKKHGYTNEKIQRLFRKFNFVNPLYYGSLTVKE